MILWATVATAFGSGVLWLSSLLAQRNVVAKHGAESYKKGAAERFGQQEDLETLGSWREGKGAEGRGHQVAHSGAEGRGHQVAHSKCIALLWCACGPPAAHRAGRGGSYKPHGWLGKYTTPPPPHPPGHKTICAEGKPSQSSQHRLWCTLRPHPPNYRVSKLCKHKIQLMRFC